MLSICIIRRAVIDGWWVGAGSSANGNGDKEQDKLSVFSIGKDIVYKIYRLILLFVHYPGINLRSGDF